MNESKQRKPIFTTDADGNAIVLVPLANHASPAKLFADDFDRLMTDGYSDQWTLNTAKGGYSYVRVANSQVAGCLESVARLVTNAGRGQVVRYRDGNRLNLRQDNLIARNGYAKGQTFVGEGADAY